MDQETLRTVIMSVSALAACASTIFAARTLRANNDARRAEFESARPYLTFSNFGMKRPTVSTALSSEKEMLDPTMAFVEGSVANRGLRPAANVTGALFILPVDRHGEVRVFPIGIADDVAPGTEWQVASGAVQVIPPDFPGRDEAPHYNDPGFYAVVAVQYEDPLASRSYAQLSFMRWPGISGGVVAGKLVATTREERSELTAKHSQLLQPYLENPQR